MRTIKVLNQYNDYITKKDKHHTKKFMKKINFCAAFMSVINHDSLTRLTITMTNLRDFSRLKTQLPDVL